jgi:threonine dehydrogenase-like Zn-dependent dehydrogenase
MYAPGDVRVEDRAEPTILAPTDAIIRLPATCICGSDLWPYRGVEAVDGPRPMGYEYAGVVKDVGSAVTTIQPGQFVVGPFFASDNTCDICLAGYQTCCRHREPGAPDDGATSTNPRPATRPWTPGMRSRSSSVPDTTHHSDPVTTR